MNNDLELSAERIHSLYLFSVLEFCVNHPYRKNPNFSGEGLLKRLTSGGSFNWQEINDGFPNVVQRTNAYATKHGINPKSIEAARGYWLIDHNKLIDDGEEEYKDMPKPQRESCKTRLGKVICLLNGVNGTQKIEIVSDDGLRKEAVDFIYGDLKEGDYVSIHQWIVSERFTKEEYEFYLQERKKL